MNQGTRSSGHCGVFGFLAVSAAVVLGGLAQLRAAPWLVITEVHYAPPAGGGPEFVEILNLEAPRVDLGGLSLDGDVSFRFPRGTMLGPGQCAVVTSDPQALAALHPDVPIIAGPWKGDLDDAGGRVRLTRGAGAVVAEARWDRDSPWSAVPFRTGHSLVLEDPFLDPLAAESWRPSDGLGGTPGRAESTGIAPPAVPLLPSGASWHYLRGRTRPPAKWRELDFDDPTWETGSGGFGYGDDDDATTIDDMRGNYLALYTRRVFSVDEASRHGRVVLRVDFDDGFAAYLNGTEVARSNLGERGSELDETTRATALHEAGDPVEIVLGEASDLLRVGKNVIAVEVHNYNLTSSDLSLDVALARREDPSEAVANVLRVNEVACTEEENESATIDWIEIYNPSRRDVRLGGYSLRARFDPIEAEGGDAGGADDVLLHRFPDGAEISPGGFALVAPKNLPHVAVSRERAISILLFAPEGTRVSDLFRVELPVGRGGSVGRSPDGARTVAGLERSSPGKPNPPPRGGDIVINEIAYHAPSGDPDDSFVEIFHRGSEPIRLGGYKLRGAVRFEFPADAEIAPGEYLVVARDPERIRARYGLGEHTTVGAYRGRLSNRGEELRVLDTLGRVVDRVTWADRSPWPAEADGGGSTLELIDPGADNSLALAWRASSESARAEWNEYRYTIPLIVLAGSDPRFFQFLLIDEGECLVDDLEVLGESGRRVFADDFDRDTPWMSLGTHEESAIVTLANGRRALRIRASGRGNPRHNYVSRELPSLLRVGERYTVSFRARWVRGSPLLLSRTSGQGLARTHALAVPSAIGTPGRSNGETVERAPPLFGTPVQDPITPAATESVELRIPIAARETLVRAEVLFRAEGESEWRSAPLLAIGGDGGDGVARLHRAEIPPLPPGRVEFWCHAIDASQREGRFPPDAPRSTALWLVDAPLNARHPTYAVLVPDRYWEARDARPILGNTLVPGTLLYGTTRLIHGVGVRLRGSPWTRESRNWRVVFGSETLDGRRSLTLDGQGGSATNASERLTFRLVDELGAPSPRERWAWVSFPGKSGEDGLYEDVEKVDGDFLDRWFGRARNGGEGALPDDAGRLYKVDDHWEILPPSFAELGRQGAAGRGTEAARSYEEAFFRFRGPDPELYRWIFTPRANGNTDEFAPLLELVRVLDPRITPDDRFESEVEQIVDVDEWLRVLAARTVVNDWDSIGLRRGKNAYVYRAPHDGRWRLIPWDADLSWSNGRYSVRGLVSGKFPAVRRLLTRPRFSRKFLEYVAFLVARPLEEATFRGTLSDLQRTGGVSAGSYASFAEFIRGMAARELPEIPFAIDRVTLEPSEDGPDRVRVEGRAPILGHSIAIGDEIAGMDFTDLEHFVATLEIDSNASELRAVALDLGGNPIAEARTAVPTRAEAAPARASEAARLATNEDEEEREIDENPELEAIVIRGKGALDPPVIVEWEPERARSPARPTRQRAPTVTELHPELPFARRRATPVRAVGILRFITWTVFASALVLAGIGLFQAIRRSR